MSVHFKGVDVKYLTATVRVEPWSYFPGESMDIQDNGKALYKIFLQKMKSTENLVRSFRDTYEIRYFKQPIDLALVMFLFFQNQIDSYQENQDCINDELNDIWQDFKQTFTEKDEDQVYHLFVPLKKIFIKMTEIMEGQKGVHPNFKKITDVFSDLIKIPYYDAVFIPSLFDSLANEGDLGYPGHSFEVVYSCESIVAAISDLASLLKRDMEWISTLRLNESVIFNSIKNNVILLSETILEQNFLDLTSMNVLKNVREELFHFDAYLDEVPLDEADSTEALLDVFIKKRVYALEKLCGDLYDYYEILVNCINNKEEVPIGFTTEELDKIEKTNKKKKKKKPKKGIKLKENLTKTPLALELEKNRVASKEKSLIPLARAPSFKGGTAAFLAAQTREKFTRENEGPLLRHIVWSLDHLAVLQDLFSSNFGPEHNLTLYTGLVGTSSRVLELVYRYLSGAPFLGHDLKKIYKTHQSSGATPQIVDQLIFGSHWSRFFFVEVAKAKESGGGKILTELVRTANLPTRIPQETFKATLINLHQKVVAEVEQRLSLETPPMDVDPSSENDSFDGCDALIGIVDRLEAETDKRSKNLQNALSIHMKQSKAAWQMLRSSLKQMMQAKDDKAFAFFSVQVLAQLQGGTEQLLHALEHTAFPESSKIHEIAILAKNLGIDSSAVDSIFVNLTNKSRYPAEHLHEGQGALMIDSAELLAQGYGRGHQFPNGAPKILWKLPEQHVNFNKQALINYLTDALVKVEEFLREEVFSRLQNNF